MPADDGVLSTEYSAERRKKPALIFRYRTRAQLVCNAIQKHLGRCASLRVLDFGAAEGLTLLELNRIFPGHQYVGIEYSSELIGQAPPMPDNIQLLQGDVTHLPEAVRTRKFDVVSALAVLEHLHDPVAALRQAVSALESGGLFIATVPNPFWDHLSTRLGLLKGDQHAADITRENADTYLGQAGLVLLSYERFMWAPVSFLPYLHIPVNPQFSLKIDAFIRKLQVFNCLYVNQAIIARKP